MRHHHLYIKQHQTTKLKYFGYTNCADPHKYRGSGKYWLRHIKKHGPLIDTIDLFTFTNKKECKKFAVNFSKQNNIVESNEWANLVDERGEPGNPIGIKFTEEHKAKLRKSRNQRTYVHRHSDEMKLWFSQIRKGKPGRPHSEETKQKIGKANRRANLGKKASLETRLKQSLAHRGKQTGGDNPSAKAVVFDGQVFASLGQLVSHLNTTRYEVSKMIARSDVIPSKLQQIVIGKSVPIFLGDNTSSKRR